MSKRTKIIGGAILAGRRHRRPDRLHPRAGQGCSARDDRQGREAGPRLQGHGQRQDPGPAQGRHVRPGHGADRQPGGQGRRPRQEGPAPSPDRPGAARRRRRRGAEASLEAMRHDLDAARATAAQAKFDYERAAANFKGNILAEADLPEGQVEPRYGARRTSPRPSSACARPSASLAASRDSLSKTTVTAPLEGIVTALPIKEGEVTVIGTMNNAGTQLMTISDMADGRGGHDGRRDLRAAGQDRAEGDPLDRRLPEPQVQGHRHRGRLLADPQERSRTCSR